MSIIDGHTVFGFWPRRQSDVSVETLAATLQQHRIDSALTYSTTGVFADFMAGNEETVQVCGRSNGLLRPVGTVDPRRYVGSLEEIDKRVGQGLKVWRLFPETQAWPLETHPVTEILERLQERGCTLMMDASQPGDPSRIAARTRPYGLPTVLLGVTGLQLGELVAVLDEAKHLLVETRRLADPQVVRALAQRFGAERLVFGTASPLQYVSSARLPLERSGLSDEQRALVMGGNVARLVAGAGG